MNTPGKLLKVRKSPDAYGVLRSSRYAKDLDTNSLQAGNVDLYKECCGQVVRADDFGVHVLMMPGLKEPTLVIPADDHDDFGSEVARLTGKEVEAGDMIVLMGDAFADEEWGENEMMEVVLSDVAEHINTLWPVADRSTGWIGTHIGWAAVASVIAGAHQVLRMLDPCDAVIDRIKDATGKGIVDELKFRASDPRQSMLQARPAMEAVESVCAQALETHGDYLSLPTNGRAIANAAKAIFLDAVDGMVQAPKAIL